MIPVAYLCLGYPVEFSVDPILQTAGWRERLELNGLMHFDGWGTSTNNADWQDFQIALTDNSVKPLDSTQ